MGLTLESIHVDSSDLHAVAEVTTLIRPHKITAKFISRLWASIKSAFTLPETSFGALAAA